MSLIAVGASDIHAGSTRAGHYDAEHFVNSSWVECIRRVGNVVDLANERKADLVYLAGDVFDHGRPSAHVVSMLVSEFNRLDTAKVIIANGNHDQAGVPAHNATPVDAYLADQPWCFHAAQEPGLIDYDGVQIAVIPWARVAGTNQSEAEANSLRAQIKRLADKAAKKSGPSLLFGHIMLEEIVFNPALQGSEQKMAPGALSADVPVGLLQRGPWTVSRLGHIHKRQQVTTDVGYIGSPFKVDFGEAEELKGAEVLTLEEDGTYELEFVPFDVRQLIALDISEGDGPLDLAEPAFKPGDVLRLTVPSVNGDITTMPKKVKARVKELRASGVIVSTYPKAEQREVVESKKPLDPALSPKQAMKAHIDDQADWTSQRKQETNEMFADILSRVSL